MAEMVAMAVATMLLAAGCSDGQVERSGNAEDIGYIQGDGTVQFIPPGEREAAPDFDGPLLDGGEFDLGSAQGDIVVLNVWGSWCPPCRKEAPGLQAVHESLADDGVRFVGINTRDNETAARNYEDEFGITYPSVFDPHGEHMLAFSKTLPPAAIPSTLIIDREGRMAARVLGGISETSLRQLLTDVLAEDDSEGAQGT